MTGIIPRKPKQAGPIVDRFTLDSAQITAKEVTLSQAPDDSNSVTLEIVHGVDQNLGTDYIVVGDKVSWDGYGLETCIAVGDKIIISYR